MKKNNSKIYCLIEARYSSARLPGKVLKKIYLSYRTIDYVIMNAKASGIQEKKIILLTSNNKADIKIIKYVKKKYNISIFKGSEKNVYSRVLNCCIKNKIQFFIRLTADNIFIDPILINFSISKFKREHLTYLSSRTMDHTDKWNEVSDYNEGNSIEILDVKALKKIKNKVNKNNYEYPTWNIFSNPERFKLTKLRLINAYKDHKIKNIRTTLDTRKDLDFLRKICRKNKLIPGNNNFYIFLKKNQNFLNNKFLNKNNYHKLAFKVIQQREKKLEIL